MVIHHPQFDVCAPKSFGVAIRRLPTEMRIIVKIFLDIIMSKYAQIINCLCSSIEKVKLHPSEPYIM